MTISRKTSILVGVLILLAYAILGINNPDALALGMSLEVISGIAVISIALVMFPVLRAYGENISRWYVALKGVEGILMVVAGIMFFIHTPVLLGIRDNIYVIHGYIFALPALLFYFLLYKSVLIPSWLSVWG